MKLRDLLWAIPEAGPDGPVSPSELAEVRRDLQTCVGWGLPPGSFLDSEWKPGSGFRAPSCKAHSSEC